MIPCNNLKYKDGKVLLVKRIDEFLCYEEGGWFGEEENAGFAQVWASSDGSPLRPIRIFYEAEPCGKHAEFYLKRNELQARPVYKITVRWIREVIDGGLRARVMIDKYQVKEPALEITRVSERYVRAWLRDPGEFFFLTPAVKAAYNKSVCEGCLSPHFVLWGENKKGGM